MKGERVFDGRHYLLAGRGSKEACQREAVQLRARYRYVRIVPWNPFYGRALRRALDDFAIFVFEPKAAPVCRACGSHDLSPARGTCLSCSASIDPAQDESQKDH